MIATYLKAASCEAIDAALEASGLIVDNVGIVRHDYGYIYSPVLHRKRGYLANLYSEEPIDPEVLAKLPVVPDPETPLLVLFEGNDEPGFEYDMSKAMDF